MEKFSNCCGVPMRGEYIDHLICPECKEHCDVAKDEEESEPVELVTIVLPSDRFKQIVSFMNLTSKDYEVKRVKVIDELFKNDDRFKLLKREADKAYDKLDEYMFNKRNNIK